MQVKFDFNCIIELMKSKVKRELAGKMKLNFILSSINIV